MLNPKDSAKLIELLSKAVSVNEELLNEEKSFIAAVANQENENELKIKSERITFLQKREAMFTDAARNLLSLIRSNDSVQIM